MKNQEEGCIEGKVKDANEMEEDDSSEWSLDSLQDIKGVSIHQLEQEQNNTEHRQKEKPMIEAKFPQKPSVLATAPLHDIGKVIFVVGELLIVEANNGSFVVDLDNWVSDQNKNLIGFVIDVLGKIENPFYAIKPETIVDINSWLGKRLYYIEGTSKILKDDDIKSMQSKSAAEVFEDIDDSSDEDVEKEPQRKYSEDRRDRKKDLPSRRNRWGDDDMRDERDRTRERQNLNRQNSRSRNEHNQRYLQTMYNMHYSQMMHLYNGNFNPNPNHQFPNNFPQTNQLNPPQNFSHSNVANFGSSSQPQQPFYGQTYPPNNQGINFQAFPGWSGPQQPQNRWPPQQEPKKD